MLQAFDSALPFWRKAVEVAAARRGDDPSRALDGIDKSSAQMAAWAAGERRVKARLAEIDHPISYMQNSAPMKACRDLVVAPLWRNLSLRPMVNFVFDDASSKDLFLSGLIYQRAFVQTRFPFAAGELMHFAHLAPDDSPAPHKRPDANRTAKIYAAAARQLKQTRAMQAVFDCTKDLLGSLGAWPVLDPKDFDWQAEAEPLWYGLRKDSIKAFHDR